MLVASLDEETAYDHNVALIRLIEEVDQRFIFYLFKSDAIRKLVSSQATQVGTTFLKTSTILEFKLPLPPLAEQHAIAAALSDVDALIAALDRLIAKKRDIKQAAMQELLTGKRRLQGFETAKGYKQTDVGIIPVDWEAKPLREDILLLSGHHVLARHCNVSGDGLPYLTGPADFPKGTIKQTKFTTDQTTLCQEGDILVTVKGSGSGTLNESDRSYCISRQLMSIHVKKWDNKFLFYSLLQNGSQIKAASTGVIPGLSRSDIFNQKIPLPPNSSEQRAIAAVLSDMDAEIAALEARREKIRALKQGMMQELLTGRIRLA